MKWLFLLLLIVNVAFFSWSYFSEGEVVTANRPQATSLLSPNQLQLLSELTQDEMPPLRELAAEAEQEQPVAIDMEREVEVEAEQEIVQAPPAVVETVPPPQRHCFRVSDIAKKKTVEKLLQVVEQGGGELLSQGQGKIQIKKYWVMLPPYQSRSAAIAAITQLKKTRVKDYYRIRSGDYVNAISLGVFSTIDAAKRRVREVKALTAKIGRPSPRVEEIELPAKRFWVVYAGPSELQEGEWRKRLEKIGRFQLDGEACPTEATN